MSETRFYISKMDCATEEQIIQNRLRRIKEIERLDFDLMNRVLTVGHGLESEQPITDALNSIGMGPQVLAPGQLAPEHGTDASSGHDHDHGDGSKSKRAARGPAVPIRDRWFMGIALALAAASEAVAFNAGEDALGASRSRWLVITLAVLAIALGGRDTIRKGIIAVKTFTLNINFLMTIAIIGAAFIDKWPEAAMVTVLFGLAEMIEAFSLERARNAIRALMELTPEVAWVKAEDGQWVEVQASEIKVGQVIRVRPGERIPLDGKLVAGASAVNQAPITGESIPVPKEVGDTVFAGTINEKGSFEFEVTANSGQTTLARIIRAVQQAQGQKAPTQRFVDKFARIYTPVVVVAAILIAALPTLLFGQPFTPWLYKALVLLVIACPCALVISTPVTVVSALASAARRGILVKGGVYMEGGRNLKTLALDKTGTLTHGEPKVTDVVPFNGVADAEVRRLAATLDAPSEHPVASAIVSAFDGRVEPVEEFLSITGRGVSGKLGGKLYYIGNHRLAHEKNYCSPEVEKVLERLEEEGKTVVILGDEQKALGVLAVADTLRATSIEAIKDLHDLGVKTLMLTGDNERTAKAIAHQVGMDDARGGLLPEDKLRVIEELATREGHVGMVGDGINDAPALAKADIGFAMGAAGTDTAIETADVALMQDDLRKIPEFIRLSRKASSILVQNIVVAIGIKAVFFVLAFIGAATLWMAVFADVGASLLVVGNGLRILRPPRSQPPAKEAAVAALATS